MHETSLARTLLDVVLARAGTARVLAIRGRIAEDEALSSQSLALHFAAHARGTTAEGAALDLELVHVRARCSACGGVFLPDHHVRLCTSCGSTDTELLDEPGVRVVSIEVDG